MAVNTDLINRFGLWHLKEALECLHKCGMCHEDVKASNIFIGADGSSILGDYGGVVPEGQELRERTPSHWPRVSWGGSWFSNDFSVKFR